MPGQASPTLPVWLSPNGNVPATGGQLTVTPPFTLDPWNSYCDTWSCFARVGLSSDQMGSYHGSLTATIRGVSYSLPLVGRVATDLASVSFDQPSLTFDTWYGKPITRTATLTNSGTGPLAIYSIDWPMGSNNRSFSQTNDCGSVLGPGLSCHFVVTFTPYGFWTDFQYFQVNSSVPVWPSLSLNGYAEEYYTSPYRPSRPTLGGASSSLSAVPSNLIEGDVSKEDGCVPSSHTSRAKKSQKFQNGSAR